MDFAVINFVRSWCWMLLADIVKSWCLLSLVDIAKAIISSWSQYKKLMCCEYRISIEGVYKSYPDENRYCRFAFKIHFGKNMK